MGGISRKSIDYGLKFLQNMSMIQIESPLEQRDIFLLKERRMGEKIVKELDRIFKARSIAVIGASNTPPKWGYRMVNSPLKTGYRGTIYPEKEVCGLRCYSDIRDIEDEIDMAVIVVPAELVPGAMIRCAQKGVKGAVIITAGFAEVGEKRNPEKRFTPSCPSSWQSS